MKVEILSKDGTKIIDINRRKAIRERCLNCSGWSSIDVKDCTFFDCQLYIYRSGLGKQSPKLRAKAIRDYCLWCCNGQKPEVKKCPAVLCPLWTYRKHRIDRSKSLSLSKKGHIRVHTEAIMGNA